MAMAHFAKYSAKVTRHLHVFCWCKVFFNFLKSHRNTHLAQIYCDDIPIQTELHVTFLLFYNILLSISQQFIV